MNMEIEKIKEDIEQMLSIFNSDLYDLSEYHKNELYRITGFEKHHWDYDKLIHFIDGMLRTIYLLNHYKVLRK